MLCTVVILYNLLESLNARSERLTTMYSDPMTEVYLMFYQAMLQVYVRFNTFLWREDPLIPVLHSEVNSFLKKLFSRFIKVGAIQAVKADIISIDYENQLPGKKYFAMKLHVNSSLYLYVDTSLFIGIMTCQLLMALEQDGDISSNQVKKFYKGVQLFYISAVGYAIIEHLPLNNTLLKC